MLHSLQKLPKALGSWCADTVAYVLSNDVSLFLCAPLPISFHLSSTQIVRCSKQGFLLAPRR